MNSKNTVRSTLRNGYRNLVGIVLVSLLFSLSLTPLIGMALLGNALALVAGLWATSLLLGVVLVGTFRFLTSVAERNVPIAALPEFRPVIADPVRGLTLGGMNFVVLLAGLAVIAFVPSAFRSVAVGLVAVALVDWYLLVSFAAPELAEAEPIRVALRRGMGRLLAAPEAVATYLGLSAAAALVAGVTVVTIGLLLPGTLCLLAAQVTTAIDEANRDG